MGRPSAGQPGASGHWATWRALESPLRGGREPPIPRPKPWFPGRGGPAGRPRRLIWPMAGRRNGPRGPQPRPVPGARPAPPRRPGARRRPPGRSRAGDGTGGRIPDPPPTRGPIAATDLELADPWRARRARRRGARASVRWRDVVATTRARSVATRADASARSQRSQSRVQSDEKRAALGVHCERERKKICEVGEVLAGDPPLYPCRRDPRRVGARSRRCSRCCWRALSRALTLPCWRCQSGTADAACTRSNARRVMVAARASSSRGDAGTRVRWRSRAGVPRAAPG